MLINDILKNPWDIFEDVDDETKQEFELSDLLVDIACKIINYRLDNNITQKELAEKLDITQAMVSKIESGEYNPSVEFLFKISKKLGWRFDITFQAVNEVIPVHFNIENEELVEVSNDKESEKLEELKVYAA